MLIVGAKGFAKEVLEILHQQNQLQGLAFYDDVHQDTPDKMFTRFPILKNGNEVRQHFLGAGPSFTIGIGNPALRYKIHRKFEALGGVLCSTISPLAQIGSFDVEIGTGTNILAGANVSNSVITGIANIIYYHADLTHDVITGDYVEISPGAKLLGRSRIGSFSSLGSNAVILPDITVGKNVTVGAGAVVVSDLPDHCVAAGVPARIIKFKDEQLP